MKPKVFIVCTGLGNINRGYESFTNECFNALKQNDYFELILLKGAGRNKLNEFSIYNLRRKSKTAIILSKLLGKEPYFIEQFTFLIGMLPKIIQHRPSIIYFSDFLLGTFLWHLRIFSILSINFCLVMVRLMVHHIPQWIMYNNY